MNKQDTGFWDGSLLQFVNFCHVSGKKRTIVQLMVSAFHKYAGQFVLSK